MLSYIWGSLCAAEVAKMEPECYKKLEHLAIPVWTGNTKRTPQIQVDYPAILEVRVYRKS